MADLKKCCLQIKELEQLIKTRYPILNYPNLLGTGFIIIAFLGFVLSSYAYIEGIIPWYACLLLNALAFSIFHEIEHDVIHNLYFHGKKYLQDFLFGFCWLMRPNIISPWIRKKLHLLHHKESGTSVDIEEMLIGNGMPWGIKRILVAADPGLFCLLLRFPALWNTPQFEPYKIFFSSFLVMFSYSFIWTVCLYFYIAQIINWHIPVWMINSYPVFNVLLVIWVLPNMLRSICLILLSSNNHYHGNVRDIFQQTQVLNKWYFLPAQLFCFNFGATHAIHHVYTPQPFYLRQLIRRKAYAILKEHGVKFNDLGTFARSNRYPDDNL